MIAEKLCYVVVFLSEAMIVCLYLDKIFIRKGNEKLLNCSFALCYAVLFFISFLGNTTLNAASCCFFNFTLIALNYRCKKTAALLHTAFLCFAMTGSEILVLLIFNKFEYEFSAHTYNFNVLCSQVFLSKLLYLVIAMVGSHIATSEKKQHNEPKYLFFFYSFPIISALLSIFTVYFGMTSGFTEESGLMMLMTILTLLIANLIFLALYNYILKANEDYLTLQLSIQKEQADIAYYKALQEQFENQRILVHDIKRHLNVIDALAMQAGATKIEKYVSELNSSLIPSDQAKLCTDSVLNLVLLRFRDECKKAAVDFQCDIREKVSDFMDSSSITTLYGNLLSNALESAVQSDKKQIELSATWNETYTAIIISVVNSCDTAPTPNDCGGFHTNKDNKHFHGVGLRSIERIVKKYHGNATMYYDSTTKQFHHIIQFFTNQL